jgi:uncharacterized membrane protein
MKIIAVVLNLILILVIVIALINHGKVPDGKEILLAILFLIAPTCSLIALLGSKDNTWLSLYLRRKALEEEQKIQELNKHKES